MSEIPNPSGPPVTPPSPPPVLPGVAEYIKAFDKPLTADEKAAWMAEITHLVLVGTLPQAVYPVSNRT